MSKLFKIALSSLALLGLAATPALADVPPPDGFKRVPYSVQVTNLDTLGADKVLFVFPWSMSNGRPMAEVGVVTKMGLGFGRRISGSPAFYLIDKAAYDAWRTAGGAAADLPPKATRCAGSINRRHQVKKDGPSEIIDKYVVTAGAEGCKLALAQNVTPKDPPKDPAATTKKSSNCAAGDDTLPFGLAAALLVLIGLVARRRA